MNLMPEDPDRPRATPGCFPELHPRDEDPDAARSGVSEEEC